MNEGRIGVADEKHPDVDELEIMLHGYMHHLSIIKFRGMGWIEHPDYESRGNEELGFFKMMYLR